MADREFNVSVGSVLKHIVHEWENSDEKWISIKLAGGFPKFPKGQVIYFAMAKAAPSKSDCDKISNCTELTVHSIGGDYKCVNTDDFVKGQTIFAWLATSLPAPIEVYVKISAHRDCRERAERAEGSGD